MSLGPLTLSFEVDCPPAVAFDLWTLRIDTWWPADHTATGDDGAEVVLEPRHGGRIYERHRDGSEVEWGEVTLWDPPARLGYLWHLRRDRADATDVVITFVDLDGGRTRVEIVHTGWERLGGDGPVWRERNTAGWQTLVPHFVGAAGRPDR